MKKFILYVLALLGTVIGMFSFNLISVNANFTSMQDTGEGTNLPGASNNTADDRFVDSIRRWIGWLMTVLAVLTLIVLVYGGILMITAAGDEDRYKKWFTILKQAAVWLIFLGLARLFIMLVFFVIDKMVTTWG